jgi:hypothetical protein
MKKIAKLSLLFVSVILLNVGCGGDDEVVCKDCSTSAANEALYVGTYTGKVSLNVKFGGSEISVPISTTFTVTNPTEGDDKLTVTSTTLANGTLELIAKLGADCKTYTVDEVSLDELEITNLPNTLAGGLIKDFKPLKILNFKATGDGTLDCEAKNLTVNIRMSEGTTSSPNAALNNLDLIDTDLTAILKK